MEVEAFCSTAAVSSAVEASLAEAVLEAQKSLSLLLLTMGALAGEIMQPAETIDLRKW
ncbi:hypothetical protein QJS10_CPA02g01165 [Acorus calamus]|uniref:Uncharacterized protein n=1 Tax=Acorus calamus TaxID=4465 RepID=A0AAV9FES8_ACOCL|nr:hypothetical protein QJS10_CPA02g01165 [Acorus calamus]